MKTLKKILGVIAIIILAIVAFVFLGSAGVKDAAEEVLILFEEGKAEEVYENSFFPDEMSFETFSVAMGEGTEYDIFEAEKLAWTGRGFENKLKYITGDFRFQNGHEQSLRFEFVKEDGELKLVGILGE